MNNRSKNLSLWKIGLAVVIFVAIGAALFSMFSSPSIPTEAFETNSSPSTSPSSAQTQTPSQSPSVLSESVDAAEPSSTAPDAAMSYEEQLAKAQATCQQSGLTPGTPAFDSCTEQTIQQYGH